MTVIGLPDEGYAAPELPPQSEADAIRLAAEVLREVYEFEREEARVISTNSLRLTDEEAQRIAGGAHAQPCSSCSGRRRVKDGSRWYGCPDCGGSGQVIEPGFVLEVRETKNVVLKWL